MNVPFYIAKKQGFQQRNAYTASIVRIGIIATALSVAVMIIAFSFINGFKHTVKEKVTQFWGDFTIADFGLKPQANLVADAIYKDARIEHVLHENKNVDAYFPYILRPAILHANQLMEGIQLKGVDASFHWPTTMQYSGEALSKIDSSSVNAIVLSSTTANRLRLQKGSDLFVYFLQKESNVPKIRKLKVVGLYHTGMEELDKHFAFCQLSLLQKVNQWNAEQISGYQVHVVDPLQAASIANTLQQQYLQAPVVATTTSDLYASIFDWLHLQDMNARIIYIIMILVAMIN
ncbi:MAG: ABC transporter permease, partial [Bacteroidota bacterium]